MDTFIYNLTFYGFFNAFLLFNCVCVCVCNKDHLLGGSFLSCPQSLFRITLKAPREDNFLNDYFNKTFSSFSTYNFDL